MKKLFALTVVLAIAGCKKKNTDETPPTPTPTPVAGSGSASETGSGSATTPATTPTPTPPAAKCELKVQLAGDGLTWTAGADTGEMPKAIDVDKLKSTAKDLAAKGGPCTALIDADDKVLYQNVITAMDAIIAGGIADVALDIPGGPAPSKSATDPTKPDLKSGAVVVISKDAVTLDGKEVGKLADAKLDAALATAFTDAKKTKPSRLLIVQADKDTTWANLSRIVGAGTTAGFPDVLFAVKNN
jgi:biopolymer transport protein ExbD